MSERLDRVWPSLVALVGTVGVVVALLMLFGDNTTRDSADDVVAGDETDEHGDAGDEAGTDTGEPTDDATEETSPDETEDPDDDALDDEGSDEDAEPDSEPTTAPPELRTPVGIANQTAVEGLEFVAQERFEAGGWEVAATSGFNGTVPETTVYYPPGMEDSAVALSRQFPEISRVAASFEGLNPSRIVVILVDDYLDAVDH
jgi:hypothetical protein